MNTVFDVAPLWRSGIGFDHLFDVLGKVAKAGQADGYPPYDIEKTGEDVYRLTLAVAGWTPDQITVTAEPNSSANACSSTARRSAFLLRILRTWRS